MAIKKMDIAALARSYQTFSPGTAGQVKRSHSCGGGCGCEGKGGGKGGCESAQTRNAKGYRAPTTTVASKAHSASGRQAIRVSPYRKTPAKKGGSGGSVPGIFPKWITPITLSMRPQKCYSRRVTVEERNCLVSAAEEANRLGFYDELRTSGSAEFLSVERVAEASYRWRTAFRLLARTCGSLGDAESDAWAREHATRWAFVRMSPEECCEENYWQPEVCEWCRDDPDFAVVYIEIFDVQDGFVGVPFDATVEVCRNVEFDVINVKQPQKFVRDLLSKRPVQLGRCPPGRVWLELGLSNAEVDCLERAGVVAFDATYSRLVFEPMSADGRTRPTQAELERYNILYLREFLRELRRSCRDVMADLEDEDIYELGRRTASVTTTTRGTLYPVNGLLHFLDGDGNRIPETTAPLFRCAVDN